MNWNAQDDGQDPDATQVLYESTEDPNDEENACTGSYIKPYPRALHETIPISGTDVQLHYSSQRTADYQTVVVQT